MNPQQVDLKTITQASPTSISIPQSAVIVSLDDLIAQMNGLNQVLVTAQTSLTEANGLLERVQGAIAQDTQKVSDIQASISAQQQLIDQARSLGVKTSDEVAQANQITP